MAVKGTQNRAYLFKGSAFVVPDVQSADECIPLQILLSTFRKPSLKANGISSGTAEPRLLNDAAMASRKGWISNVQVLP
jgi:hypothetical protein